MEQPRKDPCDGPSAQTLLEARGVRPTANRILVVRELMRASCPMSLADLETRLDTLDKASIFRVLDLFAARDIVHAIEDGSRSLKYELCHSEHAHSIADQHVHFFCERCGRTHCFEQTAVPAVSMPPGFEARSVNYMIKGLCPACAARAPQP